MACPKCGEPFYTLMNNAQTMIHQCIKCGHQMREYQGKPMPAGMKIPTLEPVWKREPPVTLRRSPNWGV